MNERTFAYFMYLMALVGCGFGYKSGNPLAMGINVACAAYWTYVLTRRERRAPETTDE